ncbi:hypothetical protein 2 [Changjiang tombus-like virus 1]|uniref:hypothetical protein 2 n=1 Tax=Changjiang tombus-like virus 1 TaxID=1922802 RepID=UPI00090BEBAB|nr:hypothetical protein 2 [Changjiang tombus-like virus 1]APG76231.1 hypothetical protein 2 [Changjiang tombus-like virus 1]
MARKRTRSSQSSDESGSLISRNRQPPRPRVRGSLGTNTILRGVEIGGSLVTDANGSAAGVYPLIAGSLTGLTNSPINNIAKYYNSFVYQSAVMHYIPAVGLTTPGQVTAVFINNTEWMSYALDGTRTVTELGTLALSQSNAATHAVWHEFSYAMNLPSRRKRFDVNSTLPTATVDVVERDCQGVFILFVSGAPANTTISVPRRSVTLQVEGMSGFFP